MSEQLRGKSFRDYQLWQLLKLWLPFYNYRTVKWLWPSNSWFCQEIVGRNPTQRNWSPCPPPPPPPILKTLREPSPWSSSSLSLKRLQIGYEPTKMSWDHFWGSISRDTNLEVSALSQLIMLHRGLPSNVLWGEMVAESVTTWQKWVEITFGGRYPGIPTWRFLHCRLGKEWA